MARPVKERRARGTMPMPIGDIPLARVSNQKRIVPTELDASSNLVTAVQRRFDHLLGEDAALARLIQNLRYLRIRGVVFGGWPRDQAARLLADNNSPEPRDVDIVVAGMTTSELKAVLGGNPEMTMFGGFALRTDKTALDIWPLEETFLIARFQLPAEFQLLPIIVDFNINAIILKPLQLWSEPSITEAGCLGALRDRRIDFQYEWIPFPVIQAARIVIYCAKLHLSRSAEIDAFLRSVFTAPANVSEAKAGILEYCPDEFVPSAIGIVEEVMRS